MYHITLLINVFFLVVPSLALNASIYHVNQSNFSNEKIAGTYIDVIDDLQAAALFEKGMAFAEQRRLDSAVFYFKQVLPYYRQQERWLPYFEAQYYVSLSYTLLERNPTKTNDSLVMLLSLTERIGENAKDGAAEMYFALAWLNDNVIRDRVKAKECYLKSLEIRKKLYGNFHIKTAKSYANASQICMSNRDLAEAEQLLITALRVYPVVYGADHPENFRIYGAAFNVYQALGQFEKSLRYAHALYKFVNEKQMSLNEQLSACRYLTQVYFDLAQYEKSLEYALEEKMLLEKSDNVSTIRMAEVLNNIGRIYEFINPAEALHYTLASLKQKESLLGVTDALSLSSYLNYGNLLSKSGEQQSAEAYLKKGLAGYQMLPPSMTYEVIRAHGLLAQHYGRYGNPELVEENFNRARHLFDNASAEVKSNWVAFNYYCLASAAHLSNLTQNPQELLSELQHVKNVIQQYRSRAHLPADEKAWMNTSSSFHAFAMDALFAALEVQDNNHVKDKLFEAMEGSRALVLLPMFRLAAAKDALDVPGELLNKLAAVRTAINEKEIAQSNEAEILKLQHSLDSLHLILKSNYPSYYAIRYGAAITSIKNVQEQLNTSQALIQYFKSENHWYAGIINKDKYRFKRLSSNISIDSLAVAYRSAIINRSDNAKQMARRLHDIIWAPLELGNDITVITVVPDGALHHISFGSIQSEEGTYLAQQFAFSYEGSASLFVEKRRQ
ncbi:MAG TPA: tetratricopeptide repeat protein, partial [Cyclobacteriaceae bacterium]|nr:tetratricopeptide repeat protein [Cyclobacteriaceae bacterium]